MTDLNPAAPGGSGTEFSLEAAIDGAIASEGRRQRAGQLIEDAHRECQEILKSKFDQLVRLSLPEVFLKSLDYEIRPGIDIYKCSCALFYRDCTIFLTRPINSLNDWRVASDAFGIELCPASHLHRTLLLCLSKCRTAVAGDDPEQLDPLDGDDDDAIKGFYFA